MFIWKFSGKSSNVQNKGDDFLVKCVKKANLKRSNSMKFGEITLAM